MQSNDLFDLQPKTTFSEPTLTFDFPSVHIGIAEYEEGPTGCTVFYFPKDVQTAVDIRGDSPGTIGNYEWNNAICFAGGSLYGLEAATGVAAELFAQNEYNPDFMKIAAVSGAIIYDFGGRKNSIYPDKALGRAALKAAQPGAFPLGAHGAGYSATVGNGFDFTNGEQSGQGGAFRQVSVTKIAVFTVVNAIGAIVNRQGEVVRGHLNREDGSHFQAIDDLERRLANGRSTEPSPGNTTPTIVITNQKLNQWELTQLGRQVHASMARAIQPFHTPFDGDVLYTVTTNEVENPALNSLALGVLAAEVAWDAILSIPFTLEEEAKYS
ncbi:MAG: P1 family peptidase [Chloroflexi bacterium]|nr:P1 family peptidase [Chloroflexota bacterium]